MSIGRVFIYIIYIETDILFMSIGRVLKKRRNQLQKNESAAKKDDVSAGKMTTYQMQKEEISCKKNDISLQKYRDKKIRG